VIVATDDVVLVVPRDRAQEVKQIVSTVEQAGRTEHYVHSQVFRPWGWYRLINSGDRYQVKEIVVNPGQRLSRQMHHHRAEHWIVVSGTALVSKNNESFYITEDHSTYIPHNTRHSLENPGKIPLRLIEVQSGAYLGEDDIVRFEDIYGRVALPAK
jgi:mannose-1-phosphate guanylyltransferase/mannose-6-phosphate isomerase